MIPPPPEPDSVLLSLGYFTLLCALVFGLIGFILRAYPQERRQ